METTTALPAWIGTTQLDTPTPARSAPPIQVPSPQAGTNFAIQLERQNQIFESIWDSLLDRTSLGHKLKDIASDDPRGIDLPKLTRWISKDPTRNKEYNAAKRMGTHLVLEEMIDISDGKDSMEDVARSTLRVNTRRLYLKAYNRDVFGDQPAQSENSLAGGITINIGAVQSPYAAPITTIEQEPLVLENLSNE